jgi:hypothetical protein
MQLQAIYGGYRAIFHRWSTVVCVFGFVCVTMAAPAFPQTSPEPPTDGPVAHQEEAAEQERDDRPSWKEIRELKARVKALEEQGKTGPSVSNSPASPAAKDTDPQSGMSEVQDTIEVVREQVRELAKKVDERVTVNAYATGGFESFQRADSRFDARNVELFMSGQLTSRLRVFAEIEFERLPKSSASTGTATSRQGEVEVEQGWLEYKISEAFVPRFGVILVPFGRLNLEHFDPVQDLTDRPIVMRRVIPTTWGEAGMGFTGRLALPNSFLRDLAVEYQFFAINGLTNAISDTSTRNARGAFGSDNNANKAVVGRMMLRLYQGGELGFSGYRGAIDKLGHYLTGFDIDWKFRWGPVELLGEYAYFGADRGALQFGSTTNTVPSTLQGGYAQANYYFWPEFLNGTFLAQHFSNPKLTAVFRYDFARIADDEDAGTVANKEQRYTIGMNYRPVQNYVFKVEYQFNTTRSEALERGTANGFLTSVTAAF